VAPLLKTFYTAKPRILPISSPIDRFIYDLLPLFFTTGQVCCDGVLGEKAQNIPSSCARKI